MLKKIAANRLTIPRVWCIIYSVAGEGGAHGSIAQLVEHLPYKQGVTGSSPVVSTTSYVCGPVVQLVRTLACHARGRASHGRRYYAAMREALPDMRTTSSLRAVTKFLRELKPESYFEVCA